MGKVEVKVPISTKRGFMLYESTSQIVVLLCLTKILTSTSGENFNKNAVLC